MRALLRARALLTAAILPWCGCTSVDWEELPPDTPATWRHLRLHRAADAWVLASSEDEAADSYEQVAGVVRTVREVAGRDPGRGLVIVVSRRDPLLIEDPERLGRQLGRWHAAATGGAVPASAGDPGPAFSFRPRHPKNALELDPAVVIRLAPAGIPRDDAELSLPDAVVEDVAWIAVMPSPECVEEVVDELIDGALEAADLSFFERMLAATFMGTVRSTAYEAVEQQVLTRLYEVCTAAGPASRAADREALLACLVHAGLAPENAADEHRPRPQTPTEEQRRLLVVFGIPDLHLPRDGLVATSGTPSAEQLAGAPVLGWQLLIDLRPAGDPADAALEAAAARQGLTYRRLPVEGVAQLTRAHAERLDELLRRHRDLTLVFAPQAETAAALVACRAFWIDGASPSEALELGRYHGLQGAADRVAELLNGR